jgi:hypothetical protein
MFEQTDLMLNNESVPSNISYKSFNIPAVITWETLCLNVGYPDLSSTDEIVVNFVHNDIHGKAENLYNIKKNH